MDGVKKALTAVGSLSEALTFFYKRLIENGISEAQALELCKIWMIKTL